MTLVTCNFLERETISLPELNDNKSYVMYLPFWSNLNTILYFKAYTTKFKVRPEYITHDSVGYLS